MAMRVCPKICMLYAHIDLLLLGTEVDDLVCAVISITIKSNQASKVHSLHSVSPMRHDRWISKRNSPNISNRKLAKSHHNKWHDNWDLQRGDDGPSRSTFWDQTNPALHSAVMRNLDFTKHNSPNSLKRKPIFSAIHGMTIEMYYSRYPKQKRFIPSLLSAWRSLFANPRLGSAIQISESLLTYCGQCRRIDMAPIEWLFELFASCLDVSNEDDHPCLKGHPLVFWSLKRPSFLLENPQMPLE